MGWLQNLFGKSSNTPEKVLSPEESLDLVIKEMEQSVMKSANALQTAMTSQNEIGEKLAAYQQKSDRLYKDAAQAMKEKKETIAKGLLADKANNDNFVAQYEDLYKQMSANVRKLELQLNKMQMQAEEIRSKKAILGAQLANANTQKEMAQRLEDLNNSTNAFDEEIMKLEIEGYVEKDEFEEEFAQLNISSKTDLNALNEDILQEEKRQKELAEKNFNKKIQLILGNDIEKEEKQFIHKQEKNKKVQLDGFFDAKNDVVPNKTEKLEDFFAKEVSKEILSEKKNIDSFFEVKNNEIEKKTEKLEDFFAKEVTKEILPEKKNIDSFFEVENKEIEKKTEKLEDFFAKENTKEISKEILPNNLQDFFSNDAKNSKADKIKAEMEDFFKDNKKENQTENNSKDALKDFFGENKEKTENPKKNIEDFFKD